MIDHLLTFATEAAAIRALPQFRTRHGWASNAVPVRIVIDPGEYTDIFEPTEYREIGVWFTPEPTRNNPNPEPEWIGTNHYEVIIPKDAKLGATEVRPYREAPGFHIMVAKPALDTTLRDLPAKALRIAADREEAKRSQTLEDYKASDLEADIDMQKVMPVFAGSRYSKARR